MQTNYIHISHSYKTLQLFLKENKINISILRNKCKNYNDIFKYFLLLFNIRLIYMIHSHSSKKIHDSQTLKNMVNLINNICK